jgi:hypothetical protein
VGEYVDSDLRRAAVVALAELGRSHDWRDRADAGHSLAGFAEMQEAFEPLLELVLDPGVACALAVADSNHGDWIHSAVIDVCGSFSDDLDEALRLCEEMSRDTDDRVALGACQLYEILAQIDPVLRPA